MAKQDLEKTMEGLEEQKKWVVENQELLKQRFGDSHIAVRNKEVIDIDYDGFKLAQRICRLKGLLPETYETVLISTVREIIEPKVEYLETPEEEFKEREYISIK